MPEELFNHQRHTAEHTTQQIGHTAQMLSGRIDALESNEKLEGAKVLESADIGDAKMYVYPLGNNGGQEVELVANRTDSLTNHSMHIAKDGVGLQKSEEGKSGANKNNVKQATVRAYPPSAPAGEYHDFKTDEFKFLSNKQIRNTAATVLKAQRAHVAKLEVQRGAAQDDKIDEFIRS